MIALQNWMFHCQLVFNAVALLMRSEQKKTTESWDDKYYDAATSPPTCKWLEGMRNSSSLANWNLKTEIWICTHVEVSRRLSTNSIYVYLLRIYQFPKLWLRSQGNIYICVENACLEHAMSKEWMVNFSCQNGSPTSPWRKWIQASCGKVWSPRHLWGHDCF